MACRIDSRTRGYAFPEVRYEILEDLFLIEEEENENEFNSKIAYINDLFELEDEALRITETGRT